MELTKQELEKFYLEFEGPLYNFALRWVWNQAAAQDLVQEAFVRIWQNRQNVDQATLKSLLFKTVQNLAINQRKRSKLGEQLPILNWLIGGVTVSIESDFIQKQNLELLHTALESLDEDLRKTFLICEFSDLSQEEIAQILNVAVGTVGSRRNRAIKAIQLHLQQNEGTQHGS